MRVRTRVSIAASAVVAVLVLVSVSAFAAGTDARAPGASVASAPISQPTASELNLVTITPCRIVNTNAGAGVGATPLGNQTSRTYLVGGTAGFTGQGGRSGGCGIPIGAVAIAATIAAVDPSRPGYLRVWPNGSAETSTTILNYGTLSTSTGATVAIDASSSAALEVRNYHGPTDLVIDVTGYYVKPMAGMISPAGEPYAGSSRIVSASHAGGTGIYDVVFDRDIRFCTATANVYVSGEYASVSTFYGGDPNSVRVYLWTDAGVAVDQYFYISVNC